MEKSELEIRAEVKKEIAELVGENLELAYYDYLQSVHQGDYETANELNGRVEAYREVLEMIGHSDLAAIKADHAAERHFREVLPITMGHPDVDQEG